MNKGGYNIHITQWHQIIYATFSYTIRALATCHLFQRDITPSMRRRLCPLWRASAAVALRKSKSNGAKSDPARNGCWTLRYSWSAGREMVCRWPFGERNPWKPREKKNCTRARLHGCTTVCMYIRNGIIDCYWSRCLDNGDMLRHRHNNNRCAVPVIIRRIDRRELDMIIWYRRVADGQPI